LIVVFILLGAGLLKQTDRRCWQSFGLFIISIVFVSTVVTFVNTSTPFLNVPVRGLFALPYYLLVIVAGFVNLNSRKWRGVLGCALLVVWGISISNNFAERQFLNPIYITSSKEAAAFVCQNANANDLVNYIGIKIGIQNNIQEPGDIEKFLRQNNHSMFMKDVLTNVCNLNKY